MSTYNDYEVCIINDGGDEFDVLGLIRLYDDRINIKYKYLSPRTYTFRVAQAKNLGVEISSGDRIFITDPDCLLHRNVVGIHAKSSGICGGIRHHIPSAYVNSLTTKSLSQLDKLSYPFDYRYTTLSSFMFKDMWMWQLIWGCNFSVDRDDFLSVGGFSKEYVGWGYEDLNLTSRLVESNVQTSFNFNAIVYHLDHGQVRKSSNEKMYVNDLVARGVKYVT